MIVDLWVGVDLGTQSVKVLVVSTEGIVHSRGAAPLTSDRIGDMHEQDPLDWIAATSAAMASAVGALSETDKARIGGISICATSGTIAVVDAAGAPVSTGLMYDDARARGEGAEVAAADPGLWRRLGYAMQPTWALPKIVWLVRSGALAGGGTRRIAQQADVVASAIAGAPVASDWSHSLKSGYDLVNEEWPSGVLESLGVDPDILPPVVAPGTVIGTVSRQWSDATGLAHGLPLFAGMTDGCAAQIGAGTLSLGDWHSVVGTTLVVKAVSSNIVVDDSGAVYSHRSPDGSLWFPGGASNVGAGAISSALAGVNLANLSDAVEARYSGAEHTIPLSYPLVSRGERFPVVRPDARGFVQWNGFDHTLSDGSLAAHPTELFASVLLGVACVERLAVETMEAAGVLTRGTFSSSGGGTSNRWWTQLRASMLGRSITVPSTAEGSLGMAILAAWAAAGEQSLGDTAARMSLVSDVISPDIRATAQLHERYAAFREALEEKHWIAQ